MKKRNLIVFGIVVCLLLLAGCNKAVKGTEASSVAAEKKVVLKLSSCLPTDDRSHAYLKMACDEIKEKTNGALEVQFYPNAQLGGLKDNMEQIVRGADIIAYADPGYISKYVPDIGVLTGPYLYDSYRDIEKITASDWYKNDLQAQLKEKGIKLISFNWYLGSRYYISNKVVTNPDDFDGVKARTQSFPIAISTTKAMGATPISMAFGEVYTGLSQGTIDAAESPLSGIYNAKWQEAVKHLALTAHFVQIAPLSMSQKVYDSLKPEYQKLIEETFLKYSKESNIAIEQSEAEWLEKFKADGIEVNEVDRDAFRKACQAVYSSVDNWTPGLYEKIRQIL